MAKVVEFISGVWVGTLHVLVGRLVCYFDINVRHVKMCSGESQVSQPQTSIRL